MNKPHISWLGLAAALGACASANDAPANAAELPLQDVAYALHEWTYDGPEGPRHWAELDAEFEACGHANTQSPIDLSSKSASEEDLPNVSPEYGESAIAIRNTGHTVQFDYDVGGTLVVGDTTYELQQFHFHAQSEHTLDGAHRELELHLVHKSAEGKLLVLGVFIEPGAANATLSAAGWDDLPLDANQSFSQPARHFDARTLIPGGATYRYEGSLTTPPCTEQVSWIVYEKPITMSRAQIRKFLDAYDRDFRPTQPLGTRALRHGA
ncbi:MAG: carbonic anhydrase family protein [Polyangiales bacterium]